MFYELRLSFGKVLWTVEVLTINFTLIINLRRRQQRLMYSVCTNNGNRILI